MVWFRRDKQGDELDQLSPSSFTRLEDTLRRSPTWGHDVYVKGGKEHRERKNSVGDPSFPEDQISLEEDVPQNGIKVKSEVIITTSAWEYKDRVF